MTAWTGSHSRGFPTSTRALILQRDPVCRCDGDCGRHQGRCTARSTIADHIVPKSAGGTDHPANGQGLCGDCHGPKTQREAAAGRAKHSTRRPAEAHPGLS
jgi:5-methylcytosine-specific restriction enzyme A